MFHLLKMKCIMAPVLAFADFEQPFRLETDVSKDGLGTVLSQKQSDSKYHPIAYDSRSLKGLEEKYHLSKLELLALKCAVVDQFLRILAVPAILCQDRQQPPHLCHVVPQFGCHGS